ncbi:MAG: hypothetical protein ACI9OJ_000444 [Myxococcota bacterium]|jgi:hypothetical protein
MKQLSRFTLTVFCLAALGCASAQVAPSASSEEVATQVDGLREQQMRLLYQYDAALGEGDNGCRSICKHHTHICVLSTRICDIAKVHPEHYKARAACKKATETCRETTARMPQDCWCGS